MFDKVFPFFFIPVVLVNSLFYVADLTTLLSEYVGWFSYLLWIFIAPIFLPAFLFLPWFDAWVYGAPVNENIMICWLLLIALKITLFIKVFIESR